MRIRGRSWLLFAFLACAPLLASAQAWDLAVEKSGPESALADTDVAYSVVVSNFGPDDATIVSLTDLIPAGMSFVSLQQNSGPAFTCDPPTVASIICNVAAFPSGSSADFDIVLHVPAGTPPGTFFTNQAVIASSAGDTNEENNSAVATTSTPSNAADLAVFKTGPSAAGPDTDISFTISLINAGPAAATMVSLLDTLPGNLTFVSLVQDSGPSFSCLTPAVGSGGDIDCSIASLAVGEGASFTLLVHVPSGTPSGTTYFNMARVTSTQDNNDENDVAITFTTVSEVDLTLAKAGPGTVVAGQDLSYTITLANAGPDAAVTAHFSDPLPAQTSFVSLTQNNGPLASCQTPVVGSSGTVDCSIATLANGASAAFTLVVHVSDLYSGASVVNTATADHESFETDVSDNSATVSTTVTPIDTDLAINKTGAASVIAGQDVTYTITLSNPSANVAANAAFTDAMPAQTGFVSLTQDSGPTFTCTTPAAGANGPIDCSAPSLAAGASATFTLVLSVPVSVADGVVVANSVSATTTGNDTNAPNNSSTANVTVSNQADLVMSKSAAATVLAGGDITYTLVLTNNGAAPAQAVQWLDALPAATTFESLQQTSGPTATCATPAVGANGNVSCSLASLANGTSLGFTLVARVSTSASDGSIVSNTATASASSLDPNGANNGAIANVTVSNQADLALTKTAAATVIAGGDISYTLVLTNNGASPAQAVQLLDSLPAATTFVSLQQTSGPTATCATPAVGANGNVSCSLASLANGTSLGFTLVARVSTSASDGSIVSNTATASASSVDPNAGNNSATANVTVSNQADLALTKGAAATVIAGGDITYTLLLTNNGAASALAVQLLDPLPAATTFVSLQQTSGPTATCATPAVGANGNVSCSLGTLANGGSLSFTLVARVSASATDGEIVSNTATASTSSVDPNAANNTATAIVTVSNQADLAVTKAGPASVAAGQNISYTITLANSGASPANAVQLSDTLPAGTSFVSLAQGTGPAFTCATPAVGGNGTVTCTLATLTNGASASFTLVLSVSGSFANGGTLTNTAVATTSSVDANAANNNGSASATVGNVVDLSISKSGPNSLTVGQNVTYLIGVSNTGSSAANGVQFVDSLPAGTTFVSLAQNSGPVFTCTTPAVNAGGNVTCSIATLAAGATSSFTLVLGTGGTTPGSLTNSVSVSSAGADSSPANNASSAGAIVQGAAPAPPTQIPTLSSMWLLLLMATLAAAAMASLARKP